MRETVPSSRTNKYTTPSINCWMSVPRHVTSHHAVSHYITAHKLRTISSRCRQCHSCQALNTLYIVRPMSTTSTYNNVVDAHCYALQCRRIDCEQIRNRISQEPICRRFGHTYKAVLYAADEGLRGWNVLQLVVAWFCYIFAQNQFAHIYVQLTTVTSLHMVSVTEHLSMLQWHTSCHYQQCDSWQRWHIITSTPTSVTKLSNQTPYWV